MPPTLLGLEPGPSFKRIYERLVNAERIDRILKTVEVKLRPKAEQGRRHAAKPFYVEVVKRTPICIWQSPSPVHTNTHNP